MKDEFDFDKVGKKMPYKVPADFFDKITENTRLEAENRAEGKQKQSPVMWRALSVAASVAALLLVGYFIYTGNTDSRRADKMIAGAGNTEAAVSDTLFVPAPAAPPADKTLPKVVQEAKKAEATEQHKQYQPKQLAQADEPETLEEILASISDEELLLLATFMTAEQYAYEQTLE